MIVSEVMTTKLVTVTSDDTLSHAAKLVRQYQFRSMAVVMRRGVLRKEGVRWTVAG